MNLLLYFFFNDSISLLIVLDKPKIKSSFFSSKSFFVIDNPIPLPHPVTKPNNGGKNKKLPRNSYVVSYMANGVVHNDIIVGDKTNIFDCYYDSLGKGSIQSIMYTDGQVPAKLFDKKKYLNSNRGTKEEKK